jgi:predicted nucleotidyltransferase
VIKSADREAITRAVEDYVAGLRRDHPEVRRIIWFGSWVSGLPSPGSDVDLCLIVSHSDRPYRERSVDYLPVGFPVGVDLFVYTEEELARVAQESAGWWSAVRAGREM